MNKIFVFPQLGVDYYLYDADRIQKTLSAPSQATMFCTLGQAKELATLFGRFAHDMKLEQLEGRVEELNDPLHALAYNNDDPERPKIYRLSGIIPVPAQPSNAVPNPPPVQIPVDFIAGAQIELLRNPVAVAGVNDGDVFTFTTTEKFPTERTSLRLVWADKIIDGHIGG